MFIFFSLFFSRFSGVITITLHEISDLFVNSLRVISDKKLIKIILEVIKIGESFSAQKCNIGFSALISENI